MKRPDKVRVFGRDFSIVYSTELQGMKELGLTQYNDAVVNVRDNQLPLEEADTILHEFIHVIDFLMSLELTEKQVACVSKGLIGIIQDNPDFGKFIIQPRKK